MSRRSRLQLTATILILPYLSACSLFGPRMQTITISSDPEGAKIRVNGETVGSTPLRVQVRRSEDVLIEAQMAGYETAYRTSHRTVSGLGIVDLVGTSVFLIPIIGLLSPAAWEHEPAAFGLVLDRKQATTEGAAAESSH